MKYLFRDRIPRDRLLATYLKCSGDTHPDHHDYHPHYELYIRCEPLPQEIVLGDRITEIRTPAAVLTAPFQIHAMSPLLPSEQFERHIVYFDEALIARLAPLLPEDFFAQSSNCLFALSQKSADVLKNALQELFDEALPENERALSLAMILSRIERLVPPADRQRFGGGKTYIPRILQYLYEHVADDLSTAQLAARFHVSRAKLERDFRASVGQSLHAAVMDLRLSRARALLRDTGLSVGEIATACGFGAEGYFYSFFKRATGQTPLQYRRSLQ